MNPEKVKRCPKCPFVTEFKHHLLYHTRNHLGQKPFKCALCNYEASLKGNLTKHIDAVHDGKKPFSCDICGMSFKQKQGLERHVPLVHEGIKPFQCEICEYPCPALI